MRIGYFDQHVVESLSAHSRQTSLERLMEHCNASDASAQAVLPGQAMTEAEARKFLGSMGLHGATAADLPIHALSGGQKVRLALALLTWRPPHLLYVLHITRSVRRGHQGRGADMEVFWMK
jgi:ATPase subunit of ABC transporter with duplicated ATPase domains